MLTSNLEYSHSNGENVPLQIQMKISKKRQTFFHIFFLPFWYLYEISDVVKKKMKLIVQVFLKLLTPKDMLI